MWSAWREGRARVRVTFVFGSGPRPSSDYTFILISTIHLQSLSLPLAWLCTITVTKVFALTHKQPQRHTGRRTWPVDGTAGNEQFLCLLCKTIEKHYASNGKPSCMLLLCVWTNYCHNIARCSHKTKQMCSWDQNVSAPRKFRNCSILLEAGLFCSWWIQTEYNQRWLNSIKGLNTNEYYCTEGDRRTCQNVGVTILISTSVMNL